MVGKPEVILRRDLFGGQVVVFLYCVGLSEMTHDQKGRRLFFAIQSLSNLEGASAG
jgi:hypothetical protein